MGRAWLLAVCGVLASVVALEVLLRVLPTGTPTRMGYWQHPDLYVYPAGQRWQVATGWDLRNPQHLHANNWGFVADRDFSRDPSAVGLIGDSYVEASMLPAPERPAAQLERRLGGRPVYALGTPGTALLDYARRIRIAADQLGVQDFVVLLERGDVQQALCGSGNVVSQCLDPASLQRRTERHQPPSGLRRLMRESALAQYVSGQIRFDLHRFVASVAERRVPEASGPGEAKAAAAFDAAHARQITEAVLDQFFADLASVPPRRLVFVVDANRRSAGAPDPTRELLLAALRQRGAQVVDLAPVYAAHGARSSRSLEVGPYDGHLNSLGVALVAQTIAQTLQP